MAEFFMNLGLDGLAPGLSGLAGRLSDLSPALNRAGEIMHGSIAENFASQGRPERWDPLKPETVKRKGHDTILLETGRLIGSISCMASADSLRISADVPYAQPIQNGTGPAGFPARPFLVFQDGDITTIVSLIESYITTG